MEGIEKLAKALRDAQRDTGIKIDDQTVLIVNESPSETRVCGLEVVYVPTIGRVTLGRCSWELARSFEFYLGQE